MEKFNPIEYINSIQKQKYLAIIWPLALVIITFMIYKFFHFEQIKNLSLVALIWYFYILLNYKLERMIPPENTTGFVFSPIHGKVKKIEKNKVTIEKKFWQSVDVRNVSSEQIIELNFLDKNPHFFEDFSNVAGKLIGYKSGKLICEIFLPDDFSINVSVSEKVIAGFTVLGTKEK